MLRHLRRQRDGRGAGDGEPGPFLRLPDVRPAVCVPGAFESITDTEDACQYRQELTSTGDVITAVSQNPGAIGYASVASVKDSVKALTVGGVAPSNETILDGTYVIQRPFVMVTKADAQLSAAAQAFFDYALSKEAHELIIAAGVVPASN